MHTGLHIVVERAADIFPLSELFVRRSNNVRPVHHAGHIHRWNEALQDPYLYEIAPIKTKRHATFKGSGHLDGTRPQRSECTCR